MPDDTGLEEVKAKMQETEAKRCSNCQWWLKALVPGEEKDAWGEQLFHFGECRQSPPTALSGNRTYESAGEVGAKKASVIIKQARFPHTFDTDWCGSWEKRTSG